MATCKDCLHYDVCAVKSKMHTSKEYINGKAVTTEFAEFVEDRCKHFREKPQFQCEICKYKDRPKTELPSDDCKERATKNMNILADFCLRD